MNRREFSQQLCGAALSAPSPRWPLHSSKPETSRDSEYTVKMRFSQCQQSAFGVIEPSFDA